MLMFVGDRAEMKKVKRLLGKAPSVSIEPPKKKAKIEATVVIGDQLSRSEDEDCDNVWLQCHGCLLTELDKMVI